MGRGAERGPPVLRDVIRGGSGTIVLSMDAFNGFTQISDNVGEVGPKIPLTEFAAEFNRLGITVPHGECPLVNIGGHAQQVYIDTSPAALASHLTTSWRSRLCWHTVP
jgi:hypothetical protein